MAQWIMLVVGHTYAQRRESARADSEYGERWKLSSRALESLVRPTLTFAASHEPEDLEYLEYRGLGVLGLTSHNLLTTCMQTRQHAPRPH